MAKKALENLTESMFYVLMAFQKESLCGADVVSCIKHISDDRVQIGPATLYTILGKFEKENILIEIATEGRKRTYQLTQKGADLYQKELRRLMWCVNDAQRFESEMEGIMYE